MHIHVSALPLRELAGDGLTNARPTFACASSRRVPRSVRGTRKFVVCAATPTRTGRWLDSNTPVERDARELLASAAERLALSARGYHRVLKVARTIADLDQSLAVIRAHVAEALRYRSPSTEDARHSPRALETGSSL